MVEIKRETVLADINLAERIYGVNNVFWEKGLSWIMINNFKLPPKYNQTSTNCLVIIPPGYGYGTQLSEFYLNKSLKIRKGNDWKDLPHYYTKNMHTGNSYLEKGWQWLCILPDWSSGDNLISFLKQVELFLKYPFANNLR